MEALSVPDQALAAYDGLAARHEALAEGHDYERWIDALEGLAIERGLGGRRVLDVACGTGNSFVPVLDRGYEVVACDPSPEMVSRAREKAAGRAARVLVADMRVPPQLGAFELLTCLDDAVNYLGSEGELRAASASDHPRAEVERAAAEAGVEIVAVRGHLTGIRLEREPDEERHTKLVYVARRPA